MTAVAIILYMLGMASMWFLEKRDIKWPGLVLWPLFILLLLLVYFIDRIAGDKSIEE